MTTVVPYPRENVNPGLDYTRTVTSLELRPRKNTALNYTQGQLHLLCYVQAKTLPKLIVIVFDQQPKQFFSLLLQLGASQSAVHTWSSDERLDDKQQVSGLTQSELQDGTVL